MHEYMKVQNTIVLGRWQKLDPKC